MGSIGTLVFSPALGGREPLICFEGFLLRNERPGQVRGGGSSWGRDTGRNLGSLGAAVCRARHQ